MIRIPRLRLAGPLPQRDATLLLAIAAALVIARIPMGFMALLAAPVFVLLVQGIRPRAPWPQLLRWLFWWSIPASALSLLLANPMGLATPQANAVIMGAIALTAAAVFAGGRPGHATDRIVDGLYLGLGLTWLISVFEAASGFKFISVLYPDANTAPTIMRNRLFVSALFPNYNDYSVAMVMFCLVLVAKMLFQPRVGAFSRTVRWVALLSAGFFIVHMGSRGCLLALVAGLLVLSLVSVRVVRPRAIGIRPLVLGASLAVVAAVGLLTSPYIADNSTATRGRIADNIFAMLLDDPWHALVGYGSLTEYLSAATDRYGSTLMDPHHMLLEIVLWYGLPALLVYLGCWWQVVRRGLLVRHETLAWRPAATITIAALMPLLGLVCSSTLRYHVCWLWLLTAVAYLFLGRRRTLSERPGR